MKADAICAKLKAEQAPLEARAEAIEAKGGSPSSRSALVPILRNGIARARAADARFAAVPRPSTDRDAIDQLLTGYAEEATDASNATDAIQEDDLGAIHAAGHALTKAEAYDRGLARGLGLKVCGKRD